MSSLHKCPRVGCDAMVPRATLACRRHWFKVQPALRNAVNRTWRHFDDDPAAYLAARDAAVEAMNQ